MELPVQQIRDTKWIPFLAEAHQKTFPDLMSGQLGRKYLNYYYARLLEKGFILGCFEQEELLGFVSGTCDLRAFSDRGFYLRTLWQLFLNSYNVRVLQNFFRQLKRTWVLRHEKYNAELLSIVVTESMRGKGIGKNLIKAFDAYMKERGVTGYQVFTDLNYSAHFFYDGMGFMRHKEMNLFGPVVRMYLRKLE